MVLFCVFSDAMFLQFCIFYPVAGNAVGEFERQLLCSPALSVLYNIFKCCWYWPTDSGLLLNWHQAIATTNAVCYVV